MSEYTDNNNVENQIFNALSRRDFKRSRGRWRLAFVILFILVILALFSFAAEENKKSRDHIARIEINGTIAHDPDRLTILKKIAQDTSVKAVILSIDSGGGSTVGGEELYEAITALRANKPVVASLQTTAASAAYMTAIAADRIVSRRTTITASIGVLMQHVDAGELLRKIGVDFDKVSTGPLKAEPDLDEAMSPQVRASMQALINDSYDWFVDIVADRRALPRQNVKALADGRIMTGRQALAAKLVDEIGGEIEAINWLEQEKGIAKDLPIHTLYPLAEKDYPSLARRLLGKSLGKVFGLSSDGPLNLNYGSFIGLTSSLSLDG